MTTDQIRALQAHLGVTVDGIYGPETRQAHRCHLLNHDRTDVPVVTPPAAKPWWQSRAVLGLLASFIAGLLSRYGFDADSNQITEILLQGTEVVGLAVAFWGTVTRKGAIDPTLIARVGERDVRLPLPAYRASEPDDPRGAFRDY